MEFLDVVYGCNALKLNDGVESFATVAKCGTKDERIEKARYC